MFADELDEDGLIVFLIFVPTARHPKRFAPSRSSVDFLNE